jgi:hypothetical protein
MRATRVLLIGMALLMSPAQVRATRFDLIVPSAVSLDTTANNSRTINTWGWVVATSETLTLAELQNASFTGSITGSPSVFAHTFVNETFLAPLDPNEVAGRRVVGFNALVFDDLLLPGETLTDPDTSFYALILNFPGSYTGTETFTGSVNIGGHSV